MKKIFLLSMTVLMLGSVSFANEQQYMLEQGEAFLEELGYPYQEVEYTPTLEEKIKDTKSTLEKLYFEASNVQDDKSIPKSEKDAVLKPINDKIEYYEMKLDELMGQ